jgi:ATP-dependent helicase/nuclease subunit A
MMGSEFILMRASAGSGKTYALSLRFAEFLLKDRESADVPRALPNILAITFTRNAAREMKERILDWLKEGYSGEGEKAETLLKKLGITPAELSRRAEEAVERILSGYTDFQVDTIDSFSSMVFRASAVDLGVGPDYEILLQTRDLIDYAFALFLRRVNAASPEGAAFRDILDYLLLQEGEKSRFLWDPTPKILEKLNVFQNKLAAQPGNLVLDDYGRERKATGQKITAAAGALKRLVSASGLKVSARGHYARKIMPAIEEGRFSDLLEFSYGSNPVNKPKSGRGDDVEAFDRIVDAWTGLQKLVGEYARFHARDFFLPYLRVYRSLQGTALDSAKRRRGVLFLDDVYRMLFGYVEQGIVPDIYFRLGDRIYHYLIDEFQDTSPIQWGTLEPLIDESLGRGGSLFLVGDAKQAIYGFRDADYRIMRDLEDRRVRFASAETTVRDLDVNYRSDGQVLKFVKDLFLNLKANTDDDSDEENTNENKVDYGRLAALSGLNQFKQEVRPKREDLGLVKYILFDREAGAEPDATADDPVGSDRGSDAPEQDAAGDSLEAEDGDRPEKNEIQNLIAGLHDRGWRYSDIAVLAYRNDHVVQAASWLNEKDIPFLPFSSLDIRRRKIIGEILSFLRFLDTPPDDLAFAEFLLGDLLTALENRFPEKFDRPARREFLRECRGNRPCYAALRRLRPLIWNAYFEPFFKSVGYLPLYDLVTRIYREFGVFRLFPREEAALTKLLEAIKGFEGEGRNDLREFLEFSGTVEDADENWTIDVPREIDAVKIMSIHKAKGADIPVVICLFYGESFRGGDFYLEKEESRIHVYKINKKSAALDGVLDRIYREQKDREWVDKLNALYVALTRAQHELYIIGVRKKRDRFPFDLLETVFPRDGQSPEIAAGVSRWTFSRGRPGLPRRPDEPVLSAHPVEHRTGSSEPPANMREALNSARIRRGEWIHRILSGLEYNRAGWPAEIAAALSRIRPSSAERSLAEDAGEWLARTLGDSALAAWFEPRPGRRVHREFDVCDGAGNVFRLDRVVVDPETVMIIDFKTGRESSSGRESRYAEDDRAQVRRYRELMADIIPGRPIRGMLAYLDQSRIEEVE